MPRLYKGREVPYYQERPLEEIADKDYSLTQDELDELCYEINRSYPGVFELDERRQFDGTQLPFMPSFMKDEPKYQTKSYRENFEVDYSELFEKKKKDSYDVHELLDGLEQRMMEDSVHKFIYKGIAGIVEGKMAKREKAWQERAREMAEKEQAYKNADDVVAEPEGNSRFDGPKTSKELHEEIDFKTKLANESMSKADPWYIKSSPAFGDMKRAFNEIQKFRKEMGPNPTNEQLQKLDEMNQFMGLRAQQYVDSKIDEKGNTKGKWGNTTKDRVELAQYIAKLSKLQSKSIGLDQIKNATAAERAAEPVKGTVGLFKEKGLPQLNKIAKELRAQENLPEQEIDAIGQREFPGVESRLYRDYVHQKANAAYCASMDLTAFTMKYPPETRMKDVQFAPNQLTLAGSARTALFEQTYMNMTADPNAIKDPKFGAKFAEEYNSRVSQFEAFVTKKFVGDPTKPQQMNAEDYVKNFLTKEGKDGLLKEFGEMQLQKQQNMEKAKAEPEAQKSDLETTQIAMW